MVWMYVLLTTLFLLGDAAQAGDTAVDSTAEARTWLGKIVSSAENTNYEGTFIYRRDDQLVAMRVIHVAGKDGARERLISLSGQPREVIRSQDGVICLIPSQKQVTMNKGGMHRQFPNQFVEHVKEIDKNYHVSLDGSDRIAGRAARMVVIEPKDSFRYGYRIWVDEETGLLLQSDLVNEHGRAIEQVMFTTLTTTDKPSPTMLQAVTLSDEMRQQMKASNPQPISIANMVWQITRMPSGFALAERYQHHSVGQEPAMEQLVLSDGMATVSVFIEPIGSKTQAFEGASHMGAVNAYGAVMNNHQLTVVGEVPPATVKMIGHSLTLTSAEH